MESVLENIFYRVNNKFLPCKYSFPYLIVRDGVFWIWPRETAEPPRFGPWSTLLYVHRTSGHPLVMGTLQLLAILLLEAPFPVT